MFRILTTTIFARFISLKEINFFEPQMAAPHRRYLSLEQEIEFLQFLQLHISWPHSTGIKSYSTFFISDSGPL